MKTMKGIQIICVCKGSELPQRIRTVFGPAEPEVVSEPNMDRVLDRFEDRSFDVLVISSAAFNAGRIDGGDLIEVVTAKSPRTQILFVADDREISEAMTALKAGSYQYAKLPISDEELRLLIETALEQQPQYGPNLLLRKERRRTKFQKMLGRSPAMRAVYRQIRQSAATDVPVLVTGETGTGKDLAAQAIHSTGGRAKAPYLPINLGALPRELVGSELFGHEKGSYTGAVERRKGIFERGNGGTVFLDEIGAIDEKVQISLLRLIDRKRFHRLGGRRSLSVDVRIIAATNEDLAEAVQKGSFREDLFYRLDVFHIEMPPLRERKSDIPLLIDAFLKQYNRAFQKEICGISPECVGIFENYGWPGNVREIKNVIQRAVLVCSTTMLAVEHLPPRLQPELTARPTVSFKMGTPLSEIECEMIVQALIFTGNNRKRAAEVLGISRRSLYNKLSKYSIG